MKVFIRAQISSLISTIVDFTVSLLLFEVFKVWYIAANITGALSGAITNFLLGRAWTFQSENKKLVHEGMRYFLVWNGSVLLNTGSVFILTSLFRIEYLISKILSSIAIGISFNYFFQKKFVFKKK